MYTYVKDKVMIYKASFLYYQPVIMKADSSEDWIVSGPVSSERLDLQNERVLRTGLKKGFDLFFSMGAPVDYDHQSVLKGSTKYIIGKGLDLFEGPSPNVEQGNTEYLRTKLFKTKELAKEVWEHLQAGGTVFQSIGGLVKSRNPDDTREITETQVTHVALTPYPANTDTAVQVESITKSISMANWEECPKYPLTGIAKTFYSFNKILAAGAGPGLNSSGGRAIVRQDIEGDPAKKLPLSKLRRKLRFQTAKARPKKPFRSNGYYQRKASNRKNPQKGHSNS